MIRNILTFLFFALIAGCSYLPAFAQDETGAKNLYLAHARDRRQGKPGVRISIELKRDGRLQRVPLDFRFKVKDKVKFHFETNFNAYVRILNAGTEGFQLLYPYEGASELVYKTKDSAIPQGDLWFEFDNNPGKEQLLFIISSMPLETSVDDLVGMTRQDNGQASASRPPGTASSNERNQALEELSSKDFNLVQDRQGADTFAYGVAAAQRFQKRVIITFNLDHR